MRKKSKTELKIDWIQVLISAIIGLIVGVSFGIYSNMQEKRKEEKPATVVQTQAQVSSPIVVAETESIKGELFRYYEEQFNEKDFYGKNPIVQKVGE